MHTVTSSPPGDNKQPGNITFLNMPAAPLCEEGQVGNYLYEQFKELTLWVKKELFSCMKEMKQEKFKAELRRIVVTRV